MAALFYKTKDKYTPSIGEINNDPSMTVQGETMSLRDLLARHEKGMDIRRQRLEYFDVEDLDKINSFYAPGAIDLTDLDSLDAHIEDLIVAVEKARNRKEIEESKVPDNEPELPFEEPEE